MNRKIKEIEDKRNNGGKLTDKEVKDLESLYKQRQEIAVKALSNGKRTTAHFNSNVNQS